MRQRAYHFEVGTADEETDEEQAFTEFSNLEKQTKIVDEQRRRRYFESASDYRKRMVSQRFTSIRRARQDSWVQPYSDVYEDEPSPFQDMFEQSTAGSLFGNEYDGSVLDADNESFAGRQMYGNGKPGAQYPSMGATLDLSDTSNNQTAELVSAEKKHTPAEQDQLKEGLRKPLASKARAGGDEAVPRRAPGQKDAASTRVVASQPRSRAAAAANKRSEKVSDASNFEVAASPQGNRGVRADARPNDGEPEQSLVSNQFDSKPVKDAPAGSDATRKPATQPKGFAGGRGGKRGKGPGKARTSEGPSKAGQRAAEGPPQMAGKR